MEQLSLYAKGYCFGRCFWRTGNLWAMPRWRWAACVCGRTPCVRFAAPATISGRVGHGRNTGNVNSCTVRAISLPCRLMLGDLVHQVVGSQGQPTKGHVSCRVRMWT